MAKETFQSVKVIDGFSACFRQEKSAPIHCSKLHGYSISFELTFEGSLDERNWVIDFGFIKRSKTLINGLTVDSWFKYMFDHSVIVAEDDSELEWFKEADKKHILQLRIVPAVGCERFAQLVYGVINDFLLEETEGRVKCISVKCSEHSKNSAIYKTIN